MDVSGVLLLYPSDVHHFNLRLHFKQADYCNPLSVALITHQQWDYCKALLFHNRYYFSPVDPQVTHNVLSNCSGMLIIKH